jgi:hypothetical protein
MMRSRLGESQSMRTMGNRILQGGSMRKVMVLIFTLLLAAAGAAQTNLALPAGTALNVKLETTLATFTSKTGDSFSGRVTQPVVSDGKTVIPIGTTVQGRISRVKEPRRIAGKPTIGIVPDTLILPNGERFALNATLVDTNLRAGTDVNEESQFKGAGHDKADLMEIGAGSGAGMLIGGLAGGGKGTLIGGAIGATATITHWLTKRRSGVLPAGTELVMELNRPMTLSAASSGQ